MDVLRTAFQTSLVLEWGAAAATAFVAIEVSVRLMDHSMSFQRALAVLLLTPEFFIPLRRLSAEYHSGSTGRAASAGIDLVLDEPEPDAGPAADVPTRSDLRLDRVLLRYQQDAAPALDGLTLEIAEGECVALVGSTGAGKSTVASVLLGFAQPQEGSVSIGGVAVSDLDPRQLRRLVAWVPQHPHLFDGTVAENLRIAKPAATDEELIEAVTAAHADTFVRDLSGGFNTPIGEGGARLSGGQRQRLAIARAYLKDAPFLVLDEPTSHLDEATQALVVASLRDRMHGRTTILIAHRLELAAVADTVVVMEGGRAVESGSVTQLERTDGAYSRLALAYAGSAT